MQLAERYKHLISWGGKTLKLRDISEESRKHPLAKRLAIIVDNRRGKVIKFEFEEGVEAPMSLS